MIFKFDYDKEILEILTSEGGCVTGFNTLMNTRGKYHFHPKFLKIHLEKLIDDGKITEQKIGNKFKYCLVTRDSKKMSKIEFEKEFAKFIADLKKLGIKSLKLNIDLSEKISIITDYIRLALKKYYHLNLGWLFAECCSGDREQIKIIDRAKKKILSLMKKKLNELDENDRIRIINTFLSF